MAISPATSVFDRKPPQTICFALQPSALTPNQQPLPIQQTAYLKPSNFLISYVSPGFNFFVLLSLPSAKLSLLQSEPPQTQSSFSISIFCLVCLNTPVSYPYQKVLYRIKGISQNHFFFASSFTFNGLVFALILTFVVHKILSKTYLSKWLNNS